ncbi:MAG: class I SAM-dependent DNA methyltransferase [Promethearchaeota archaeon]
MTKLYYELARVYHEMYQSIFNYEDEFRIYDEIMKQKKSKKILEIGCGSGNLAQYFLNAGYKYLGLDISEEMLVIAKEVAPDADFIRGDMRNLQIKDKFDAVIITGRCFTYMVENEDVINALKSIHGILKPSGYLIFDNFNAESIFEDFKENMVFSTEYKGKKYKRVSKNSINMQSGWTWNWNATYYITESGKTKQVEDTSILRAFTEDELRLYLKINEFEVEKAIKKDFAILIVAKKIKWACD